MVEDLQKKTLPIKQYNKNLKNKEKLLIYQKISRHQEER